MPSDVVYSADLILDEAFAIVRTKGIQALSARRVAKNLGCSPQPVYSAFGSMFNLREAALQKGKLFVVEYLLREQQDEDPFFAMGMQYFRFSREERILFELFFVNRETALTFEQISELFVPLRNRMKLDHSINQLGAEQMKRIARDMLIYTHGLASFVYRDNLLLSEQFVRAQLSRMGSTVIEWEHQQINKTITGEN